MRRKEEEARRKKRTIIRVRVREEKTIPLLH